MELKSLRCPNCNGPVRPISEGRFVCESCGTSFMADYDPEDVEIQRIKAEAEVQKKQAEAAGKAFQSVENTGKRISRSARMMMTIVVTMILISFVIVTISIANFNGAARRAREAAEERSREAGEKRESMEREFNEQYSKVQEQQEKMEKKLAKPQYIESAPDLLRDEEFVKNAKAALRDALDIRHDLFWTNWVWPKEPEYMGSYFLVAEDEDAKEHNMLISVYKVFWIREREESTEEPEVYEIYDATVLYNLSMKEDGTIKSDYRAGGASYHSETPTVQPLRGFYNFDQLYREEILGRGDFKIQELDFSDEE